jgi:hypothetical protein
VLDSQLGQVTDPFLQPGGAARDDIILGNCRSCAWSFGPSPPSRYRS